MKILNSPLEKERDFHPYHRLPLVKIMTNNSHNEIERQKDSSIKSIDKEIKSTNRLINMTYRKNDKKDDLIKLIEKNNTGIRKSN